MKNKIVSIFGATLVSVTMATAAPSNNELKIASTQEFDTLNPIISSSFIATFMIRMTHRTLVNLNADWKWVPQMAVEIPTLENGKAKLVDMGGKKRVVANWEIRENVRWGDGNPLTCADFAFAIKVASSPNVSVGEKETYTKIEKVEFDPKNPRKCTFIYDKARWDFNQLPQTYPIPKHLEEPIFEKYGKEKEGYEKNSLYTKNPTHPGLSAGPYLYSEVKLGDHVTLTPNPYFFGEPPKIKKIIVKIIQNTGTLEANLTSGTVDMISTTGLLFDQALVFEKKVKAQNLPVDVIFEPSITYEHIDLNLSNPLLKDIKVRKALLFAINREDMVKSLFENRQPVALHFLTPRDPWYTNDAKYITNYRYSKREAQKLLEEAGWKVGKDGYRYKDGKKLTFTLMTTAGAKTRETVQVYLQEQWKQVGIEIMIKNEIPRSFFGETTRKRQFDSMALFAWISSPENNPRAQLHSINIPSDKNGWSGQNYPGWVNKAVDRDTDALETEFNPKKRLDLIWNIQKAYTDEVPVIPLYYRSDIAVVPKGLKNFRLTGHQFPESNEVEKWTF